MIKDTLYYQYIKERQGAEVLEDERGFIIYLINGNECFIVDIDVAPAHRKKGHSSVLIRRLAEIAQSNGCDILTGNIHIRFENHPEVLMAAFKLGFSVIKSDGGVITVGKKVGG